MTRAAVGCKQEIKQDECVYITSVRFMFQNYVPVAGAR